MSALFSVLVDYIDGRIGDNNEERGPRGRHLLASGQTLKPAAKHCFCLLVDSNSGKLIKPSCSRAVCPLVPFACLPLDGVSMLLI